MRRHLCERFGSVESAKSLRFLQSISLWKTCAKNVSQFFSFGLDSYPPAVIICNAGWSSPVAREAHNLEVAGSNPAPAISRPHCPPWPVRAVFCAASCRDFTPATPSGTTGWTRSRPGRTTPTGPASASCTMATEVPESRSISSRKILAASPQTCPRQQPKNRHRKRRGFGHGEDGNGHP